MKVLLVCLFLTLAPWVALYIAAWPRKRDHNGGDSA